MVGALTGLLLRVFVGAGYGVLVCPFVGVQSVELDWGPLVILAI